MISLKDGRFFVGAKCSIVIACVFVLGSLNEVLSANFDIYRSVDVKSEAALRDFVDS